MLRCRASALLGGGLFQGYRWAGTPALLQHLRGVTTAGDEPDATEVRLVHRAVSAGTVQFAQLISSLCLGGKGTVVSCLVSSLRVAAG